MTDPSAFLSATQIISTFTGPGYVIEWSACGDAGVEIAIVDEPSGMTVVRQIGRTWLDATMLLRDRVVEFEARIGRSVTT